jgi:hypothetical protein
MADRASFRAIAGSILSARATTRQNGRMVSTEIVNFSLRGNMRLRVRMTTVSLLIVGYSMLANGALAGEYQRVNVHINKITAIASTRPALPSSERYYRVYVNSGSWGTSTCRPDTFDVSMDDTAILDLLLQTRFSFETIEITLDDNLRPIDATCRAVSSSGKLFDVVP